MPLLTHMFSSFASKISRQRVAQISAAIMPIIGSASLTGWILNLHLIRHFLPNTPEMKPNAAAAFILSGVGLFFIASGGKTRSKYLFSRICGAAVLLIGSVTLGEYIFGFDAGIDGMLMPSMISDATNDFALRMTTHTCFGFLLVGLMIVTLTGPRFSRKISGYLALVSYTACYAALIGHFFGAEYVYGMTRGSATAPFSVAFFAILTTGLLAANFNSRTVKLLISDSLGGAAVRKLLPAAIVIPALIGWLRVLGQERGLFDTGFGSAMTVFTCVVLMCSIVLYISAKVHKTDIRQKAVERELVEKEQRYRDLFDYGQSMICIHNMDGFLSTVNPAALQSLGYSRDEVIGKNLRDFMPEDHRSQFPAYLRQVENEGLADGLLALVSKTGKQMMWRYHNILVSEAEQEPYILGHAQDVTELLEAQRQLKNLSLTDELTGLYNRRGFLTMAEQQIKLERHERTARGLTLMFADIDGLKQINDVYGHEAGSDAIIGLSTVLTSVLRNSDLVARWGGDEFVILTIGSNDEHAELMSERIGERIREYNATSEKPYSLACSIGVAPIPLDGDRTFESIIADADEAMYAEKRRRKAARGDISEEPNYPTSQTSLLQPQTLPQSPASRLYLSINRLSALP